MSTKFSWLLLAGSALISVRLVYCGYLPAVAMLIGSTTAVLVNAPFYLVMLGWSSGTVARFFVSPIPALITSTVLFLGAALHIVNARRLADAALKREQHDAVARLEQQVALRTSELVGARDEAQQANRAKSVFLAKVSHELRTPMHAVLGYVDLVLREPITPSATKKIQAARMAGQQLVGQINDLLDYARMEREQLKLEPTSAALRALAVRLKERTDLLAAERNNQFELALAPDLPPWIWVDVGRLEQVLMVLLSNAVRYTRGGRIRLCIQLASEAWPDSQHENPLTGLSLRFEVEDTGRGIAPEALARIFQAFERGDSLDGDGLGLGLPIAQQLLGLMGSHLEVHSELGSGSRFCFTLQVRQADELPTVPLPQDHLITGYEGRTRQVLVLDDNPANRRYLEELLGDLEFDVRLFSTVSAAITHLKAMVDQAGTSPDVCLVDQRLEGAETGWDFVLALRSAQRTPSSIRDCPVLMLSATEASPPPGWALAHGIDRHLLKPVDQQLLLRTVGELLNLVWTTSAKADFVKPPAGQEEPGAEMSVRQAWKALSDMAESGDLGALDDWMQAHSRLVSVNPQLERLVQAMDFPEIAAYAQGVRRMENSSAGEPAWQGPGVSRYL